MNLPTPLASIMSTLALFVVTALAEIIGCYLPYTYLRHDKPSWVLLPAAASLGAFAWLLTLHQTGAAGRIYAAYGGVYVSVAVGWMWWIEEVRPDRWDLLGVTFTLLGMTIIALAPHAK